MEPSSGTRYLGPGPIVQNLGEVGGSAWLCVKSEQVPLGNLGVGVYFQGWGTEMMSCMHYSTCLSLRSVYVNGTQDLVTENKV